jgi:hypothetical protein
MKHQLDEKMKKHLHKRTGGRNDKLIKKQVDETSI